MSPNPPATPGLDDAELTVLLHADLLSIYDRARREVTFERADGHRTHYAANYFRRKVNGDAFADRLVAGVGELVSAPTSGLDRLADAGRLDISVEALVADEAKLYHRLFPAATVDAARQRLGER